jgi:hypothetical protein
MGGFVRVYMGVFVGVFYRVYRWMDGWIYILNLSHTLPACHIIF